MRVEKTAQARRQLAEARMLYTSPGSGTPGNGLLPSASMNTLWNDLEKAIEQRSIGQDMDATSRHDLTTTDPEKGSDESAMYVERELIDEIDVLPLSPVKTQGMEIGRGFRSGSGSGNGSDPLGVSGNNGGGAKESEGFGGKRDADGFE